MPEDLPDRMPDRMPNRMSEDMSDRMPEDLPVTKCINVMVGITRSKVIFLNSEIRGYSHQFTQAHVKTMQILHDPTPPQFRDLPNDSWLRFVRLGTSELAATTLSSTTNTAGGQGFSMIPAVWRCHRMYSVSQIFSKSSTHV